MAQRVRDILLRIRGDATDAEQDLHRPRPRPEAVRRDHRRSQRRHQHHRRPQTASLRTAVKAFGQLPSSEVDLQTRLPVKLDRLRQPREPQRADPPKIDLAIGSRSRRSTRQGRSRQARPSAHQHRRRCAADRRPRRGLAAPPAAASRSRQLGPPLLGGVDRLRRWGQRRCARRDVRDPRLTSSPRSPRRSLSGRRVGRRSCAAAGVGVLASPRCRVRAGAAGRDRGHGRFAKILDAVKSPRRAPPKAPAASATPTARRPRRNAPPPTPPRASRPPPSTPTGRGRRRRRNQRRDPRDRPSRTLPRPGAPERQTGRTEPQGPPQGSRPHRERVRQPVQEVHRRQRRHARTGRRRSRRPASAARGGASGARHRAGHPRRPPGPAQRAGRDRRRQRRPHPPRRRPRPRAGIHPEGHQRLRALHRRRQSQRRRPSALADATKAPPTPAKNRARHSRTHPSNGAWPKRSSTQGRHRTRSGPPPAGSSTACSTCSRTSPTSPRTPACHRGFTAIGDAIGDMFRDIGKLLRSKEIPGRVRDVRGGPARRSSANSPPRSARSCGLITRLAEDGDAVAARPDPRHRPRVPRWAGDIEPPTSKTSSPGPPLLQRVEAGPRRSAAHRGRSSNSSSVTPKTAATGSPTTIGDILEDLRQMAREQPRRDQKLLRGRQHSRRPRGRR